MGNRHLRHALTALREAWDRRALENALFYVATGRGDRTREEFFASGRRTLGHFVLTDTENICQGLTHAP